MYPNPQQALPLDPLPRLDAYDALATELVAACQSREPSSAIADVVTRWLDTLAVRLRGAGARKPDEPPSLAHEIESFARTTLSIDGRQSGCAHADAQLVIARAHGFLQWSDFAALVESLPDPRSPLAAFESAAEAVIAGDAATLTRLLREHPGLARAQSTREHHATLLHYVSANGVEGYRQVSPQNSAEMAEILLAAGAPVDAEADVYAGACTPLGLVATSAPPSVAGVQRAVMDVLLKYGARVDRLGSAGHHDTLVRSCLANGQPNAAAYLADRGAPLGVAGAAGLGRVDVLNDLIARDDHLVARLASKEVLDAFSLACAYGRAASVAFFLDRGLDVNVELGGHGDGSTGLHLAALYAHVDVVKTLLARGAHVDSIDKTWKTPPLVWALTGWSRRKSTDPCAKFYEVVSLLVAAGAAVTPNLLEWDKAQADPQMLAALTGKSA